MPKKLALFILGFMLAVGVFLLYQYISGARPGTVQRVRPPTTSAVESLPPSYEERDAEGNLIYLIRAKNAPVAILDEVTKQPLPGQYQMENPEATFYQLSGRVVRLTADACRIVLDQAPRMPMPGMAGKVKDQINLRSGELRGNVRLYISGLNTPVTATNPAATNPKDFFPGGARIYFDGPVRYDRALDQLTSADDVHIRSETASYDGTGLRLAINQTAKRIDFLRIEKGKELLLRNMGSQVLEDSDFGLVAATSPATLPASRPGKSGTPRTVYRLAISQNIHATAGDRSIAAEQLNITFAAASESKPSTNPATVPATAPDAVAQGPAPEPVIPDLSGPPEPIVAAGENDVHILWSGPLELRPLIDDKTLADSSDMIIEAIGSAATPVRITNKPKDGQQQTVAAGRLFFHRAVNLVQLEPGSLGHVELGEAGKGSIECASMIFEGSKALFKGPGKVISYPTAGENAGNATFTWKSQLALEMERVVDKTDPKSPKESWVPRHAILDNAVVREIKRDFEDAAHKVIKTTDFSTDLLEIWIATVKSDKKTTQTAERVLAKGNVAVDVQDVRRREQTALRAADMLEIVSTNTADGPIFSKMTATGKVSASRRQDKAAVTLENPNPTPDYETQLITASTFIADLKPKAKPATQPATRPAGPANGFDADVEVAHFVANDGVRIEITPASNAKRSGILAVADSLDADPTEKEGKQNFKVTLLAAADPKARLRLQHGADFLESRVAMIDSESSSIRVPGEGMFDFTMPAKKTAPGAKESTPTPLRVSWDKEMVFDGVAMYAKFVGHPVAIVPNERADQGKLTADESIYVKLKPKPVATTATAPATAPATKPSSSPIVSQDLDLDWIEAVGNVRAVGAQFDNNRKVRDLAFSAQDQAGKPGKLRYTAETDTIEIPGPGALVMLMDFPAKVGTPNAQSMDTNGQSTFLWKESLVYDGKAGLITFKKAVDFTFTPRDGFKFSQNLAGLAPGAPRGAAAGVAKPKDSAHLTTELLIATVTKKAETRPANGATVAASPIGLDASQISVSTVDARGGAYIDVSGFNIAGETLSYNVPNQTVQLKGEGMEGVVVTRPAYGERGTAPEILLNMSKENGFFTTPQGFQGNISGVVK